MIAKLLKARRSRNARRRKSYRPFAEQLEARLLLAHGGGFVTLEYDTTLESLDLSGGPFPMPLANAATIVDDVGDGGPASVDGYGFVNSTVTVNLSSQRAVSPGPATEGKACAFFFGEDDYGGDSAAAAVQQDCDLRGEAPEPGGDPAPIDPVALNGHQFFVDSFFDVFFDITVTDVDPRPGRDFAGPGGTTLPDGASVVIEDQGPGFLQSFYFADFNKDLPNYGLVPPPPAASRPYVGHFDIAIPLPDVNGNGDPDFLKFQLASHLAGAATFIQLPDGTVIDQFDSTASILGAVSDDLTDPPFTIGSVIDPGACTPFGSFAGAADPCTPDGTGLSGPTTATSTLLNPVISPGFSYVDADNDQLFTAGTDVALINGELDDGKFRTSRTEGGYTTVIPGSGLFVGAGVSVAKDLDFRADGDLVVASGLTLSAGKDLELKAGLDINVSGATLLAGKELELEADGNVTGTGATLAAGKEVEVEAGLDAFLEGALITAGKEIDIEAGGGISVIGSTLDAGKEVELEADGNINLNSATITAGKEVEIESDSGTIAAFGAILSAGKEIELEADGSIDATNATMTSGKEIEIESHNGSVAVQGGSLTAGKEIEIEARDKIFAALATMVAGKEIEIESAAGDVCLQGASLCAGKEIEIEADKILTDAATTLKASKIKLKQRDPC